MEMDQKMMNGEHLDYAWDMHQKILSRANLVWILRNLAKWILDNQESVEYLVWPNLWLNFYFVLNSVQSMIAMWFGYSSRNLGTILLEITSLCGHNETHARCLHVYCLVIGDDPSIFKVQHKFKDPNKTNLFVVKQYWEYWKKGRITNKTSAWLGAWEFQLGMLNISLLISEWNIIFPLVWHPIGRQLLKWLH